MADTLLQHTHRARRKAAHFGGFFVFATLFWSGGTTEYAKAPLTFRQQADLLIERGMLGDRQLMVRRPRSVSYYRLSGYALEATRSLASVVVMAVSRKGDTPQGRHPSKSNRAKSKMWSRWLLGIWTCKVSFRHGPLPRSLRNGGRQAPSEEGGAALPNGPGANQRRLERKQEAALKQGGKGSKTTPPLRSHSHPRLHVEPFGLHMQPLSKSEKRPLQAVFRST